MTLSIPESYNGRGQAHDSTGGPCGNHTCDNIHTIDLISKVVMLTIGKVVVTHLQINTPLNMFLKHLRTTHSKSIL